MLGFEIQETMSGYDDNGDPFEFNVTWGVDDWKNINMGPVKFDLKGTVLFNNQICPCEGNLIIDYFGTNSIKYNFDFTANIDCANQPYYRKLEYLGEKINIKPWNLLTSHTTCFGVILGDYSNDLVAKTNTFFKLKTIPKFLSSFRLRRT